MALKHEIADTLEEGLAHQRQGRFREAGQRPGSRGSVEMALCMGGDNSLASHPLFELTDKARNHDRMPRA